MVSVTDSTGAVIEKYEYSTFGKPTIKNAAGVEIFQSTIGNSFMFTGRMWDAELGLYDYRARVYNPKIGVFYQTDPLGYYDSTNMYAYCINDPVNFVDPFGFERFWIHAEKSNSSSGGGGIIKNDWGHSWITLEDEKGKRTSHGFWPEVDDGVDGLDAVFGKQYAGGLSTKSGMFDYGKYDNYSSMEIEISPEQYKKIKTLIEYFGDTAPGWSLDYNCTDFAKWAAKVVGIDIPDITMMGWNSPEKLAEWIDEQVNQNQIKCE